MKVHFNQMTNDLNWSPTPGCRKASKRRGEHRGWPHERTPHSGLPPGALRPDSRFLAFTQGHQGRKLLCEGQAGCTGNAPPRFSQNLAPGPAHTGGLGMSQGAPQGNEAWLEGRPLPYPGPAETRTAALEPQAFQEPQKCLNSFYNQKTRKRTSKAEKHSLIIFLPPGRINEIFRAYKKVYSIILSF